MKIIVEARPGAKKPRVESIGQNHFRVEIDALARENKANLRLLEIIADYFNVSFSCVKFVSGVRSKTKIMEVIC